MTKNKTQGPAQSKAEAYFTKAKAATQTLQQAEAKQRDEKTAKLKALREARDAAERKA